jgi:hypothetical protein
LENEIVATALEQLAYVMREYPIPKGIFTKTLIGDDGGMAPEITIQFSLGKYAKGLKPLEVEITLWRGDNNSVATLIIDAFGTEDIDLHEVAYLKHLDDAYPYFEKALDLFNLEKSE